MNGVRTTPDGRFSVLIAGAGVAGLEAAFALRAVAGDRVDLTLLTPGDHFVYRPMAVLTPFSLGGPERYPLFELAALAGAELVHDALAEVVPDRRVAVTDSGAQWAYDALIIALGTTAHPRYDHVSSVDERRMDEVLHGLIQDVEEGYVRRLAFVIGAPIPWPLPAYELALMTAARAWDTQAKIEITIITPEAAPLEVFGAETSQRVGELLAARGITVISSAYAEVPTGKTIAIHPGGQLIEVDRIVALPELRGPSVRGLPHDPGGFLPVDGQGRVTGIDRVWAAGDCTDYPVKQGGIAAQQADAVARSIAELTGGPVAPAAFEPELTGILPVALGAHTRDTPKGPTLAGPIPLPQIPKIAARYLAPHLIRPRSADPPPALTSEAGTR
jgi:sulfide:quinone oxidoreductase